MESHIMESHIMESHPMTEAHTIQAQTNTRLINVFNEDDARARNIFCNIIEKYIRENPDTRFVFLFNQNTGFSVKIKFKVIRDILRNLFISPTMKNIVFDLFCKSQRVYYVLSRFARRYQFRKAKICIETDLYLNPIERNHPMTVPVYDRETRSIFLFSCSDLIRMFMTSLTRCVHFFAEPIVCKNPYTNMTFHISTIYNIYFHIKTHCKNVVPSLIHSFFECNFNLESFAMHHEQDIRNIAAKNHIQNSSIHSLYSEIVHLFHITHSLFHIDPNFPKDLLVNSMRPYLYLYIMFMYSVYGSQQRNMYYMILKKKMNDFFQFNPHFGRKIVNTTRHIDFNSDYPQFTINDIHQIIQRKEYMSWYAYSWDMPTHNTPYTPSYNSLYRTDVDDHDDEDDHIEPPIITQPPSINMDIDTDSDSDSSSSSEDEDEEEDCESENETEEL